MANIPAHCPHCGLMFSSPLSVVGGSSIEALGPSLISCPSCKKPATIGVGKYSNRPDDDRLLRVERAAPQTKQLINIYNNIVSRDLEILRATNPGAYSKVEELAQKVQADAISETEAASEIAAHLPKESADAIKRIGASHGLKQFLRGAIVAGKIAKEVVAFGGGAAGIYTLFNPPPPAQVIVNVPPAPPISIHNHIATPPNDQADQATGPSLSREQSRRANQMAKRKAKLTPLPPPRPRDL